MTDEIEVGAEAREAAMLAVLAAGDPSNQQAWKRRVQTHLPMFAALVRGGYDWWGKEAQKIIDAQVFVSTFVGMELEESSKRIIVHMTSEKAKDGDESIRTERTDNPAGWAMQRKLEDLTPGTEIVAFKYIETIGPDKKVRVLVHFEPLRSKKSETEPRPSRVRSPQPPPPEDRGVRDDSPSPRPAEGSSVPSAGQTLSAEAHAIQSAMSDLSARQKIAVKNRCVGENITDWADPGPESIDRVLTIIKEISE